MQSSTMDGQGESFWAKISAGRTSEDDSYISKVPVHLE